MHLSTELARLEPGMLLVPKKIPVEPVKTYVGQHGDGEPITTKDDCVLEKTWPRFKDGWVVCFSSIKGTFKLTDFDLKS